MESSLAAFVLGSSKADEALRIESIYDRNIGRMKVILFGSANRSSAALKFISALLEK
jgi:hypothetical protein